MITYGRERLTDIFNDTSYLCNNDDILKKFVTYANERQEIILERDKVIRSEKKFEKPAKMIVFILPMSWYLKQMLPIQSYCQWMSGTG